MRYAVGGIINWIRNWWGVPTPIFEVGDGVRITSSPDEQFVGQVGTIVGLASIDPQYDDNDELVPDTGTHGSYKVDVRTLYTWVYCTGWELEKLTASERLYYGV